MFQTKSPDREIFNIVYDTFRHLVDKRDQKVKLADEDLTLPKETLEKFTSV